ncbi:hypothetical protein [Micromonospora purpureochromogenes]|uniref:Uncharacterized protein n=1 Tax=Micromonospora purpureochromogenes TaxID=47872 RepID=A0ABX2RS15_9ACTN|nr:hypothetical protein [Micromonospora purpureochromogenes]NYF58018.1 hypothetical protein [Micromonospora purpureochromogenes]
MFVDITGTRRRRIGRAGVMVALASLTYLPMAGSGLLPGPPAPAQPGPLTVGGVAVDRSGRPPASTPLDAAYPQRAEGPSDTVDRPARPARQQRKPNKPDLPAQPPDPALDRPEPSAPSTAESSEPPPVTASPALPVPGREATPSIPESREPAPVTALPALPVPGTEAGR